ncbi:putative hyalin, partial [Apostichopus japonicus]
MDLFTANQYQLLPSHSQYAYFVTEDTIPPTISGCPADISETIELGLPGRVITWTEPTASDTSGTAVLSSRSDAPGTFFEVDVLHITITYTFRDESGNTANCVFMIWFITVDTTPPTANSCPTDVLINVELGETEGEATWTEPSSTDLSGTDQLVSRSRAPGTPFPLGDTTVTYLYTDDSGNTATCVFCVTVGTVDTLAPTIIGCPADSEAFTELGTPGRMVSWIEPTAFDVSGTERLQSRSNAPNSFFTIGSTDVTYSFIDNSGNVAICQFNVTVTA